MRAPKPPCTSQLYSICDELRQTGCCAVLLAVGFAGCAAQPIVKGDPTASATGAADGVAAGQAQPDSMQPLRVHVVTPGHVVVGTAVHIKLVVRNTGSAKMQVIQSADPAPDYDLTVIRQDGSIVWQRVLPGDILTTAAEMYTLAPGESRDLETISWNQRDLQGRPVEPDRYRLYGLFYGGAGPSETPTDTAFLFIEHP